MSTLTVDLQDGFKGDDVVILVNGREAVRRDALHTLEMIGLAERIDLPVEGSNAEVEIRLPRRGLSARATVTLSESPYVSCSVRGGKLELTLDRTPGYA